MTEILPLLTVDDDLAVRVGVEVDRRNRVPARLGLRGLWLPVLARRPGGQNGPDHRQHRLGEDAVTVGVGMATVGHPRLDVRALLGLSRPVAEVVDQRDGPVDGRLPHGGHEDLERPVDAPRLVRLDGFPPPLVAQTRLGHQDRRRAALADSLDERSQVRFVVFQRQARAVLVRIHARVVRAVHDRDHVRLEREHGLVQTGQRLVGLLAADTDVDDLGCYARIAEHSLQAGGEGLALRNGRRAAAGAAGALRDRIAQRDDPCLLRTGRTGRRQRERQRNQSSPLRNLHATSSPDGPCRRSATAARTGRS